MKFHEISEALMNLSHISNELESEYIENEGECTESTEQKEKTIHYLTNLLTTEGINSLGRWLKAKEDEVKTLKAERDYISRRIDSVGSTIDYIKSVVNHIMVTTGQSKIKGSHGYSFTATESTTVQVDRDRLKASYLNRIQDILLQAGIPCYIGVSLTASSAKAKEMGVADGDEGLFNEVVKPTVKFLKPKAGKEE